MNPNFLCECGHIYKVHLITNGVINAPYCIDCLRPSNKQLGTGWIHSFKSDNLKYLEVIYENRTA